MQWDIRLEAIYNGPRSLPCWLDFHPDGSAASLDIVVGQNGQVSVQVTENGHAHTLVQE